MTLKDLQAILNKQAQTQQIESQKSQRLQTKKLFFERIRKAQHFWIQDSQEHEQVYRGTYDRVNKQANCCFNHIIGLPRKHNRAHGLYDYELELVNTLHHQSKYILVRKSTGLGLTTLFLRWMSWLAITDEQMKGKE